MPRRKLPTELGSIIRVTKIAENIHPRHWHTFHILRPVGMYQTPDWQTLDGAYGIGKDAILDFYPIDLHALDTAQGMVIDPKVKYLPSPSFVHSWTVGHLEDRRYRLKFFIRKEGSAVLTCFADTVIKFPDTLDEGHCKEELLKSAVIMVKNALLAEALGVFKLANAYNIPPAP